MEAKEQVNATKDRYQQDRALELINASSRLLVAKGKKRVEINLRKDRPSDEDLLKLVLGPTGNLRAPTLRVGKTLVVGFHPEMYDEVFG